VPPTGVAAYEWRIMQSIEEYGRAVFVRRLDKKGAGRVYRLDPPLLLGYGRNGSAEHVWVSATTVAGQPETYIFACDPDGQVLDWGELRGSYKGGLDHVEALRLAGYRISRPTGADA